MRPAVSIIVNCYKPRKIYLAYQAKAMFLGFGLEHDQFSYLQGSAPKLAPEAFLLVMQLPLIALWAGAIASLRVRRDDRLMIATLSLMLLYTLTMSVWFEFGARHRAYLLPILLAWSATLFTGPRAANRV